MAIYGFCNYGNDTGSIFNPVDATIATNGDAVLNSVTFNAGGTAENTNNKAVANGYASLDSSGLVPAAQIPPSYINNVYVVANQAARLALVANIGDTAKQLDTGITYMLQQLPASTNGNWIVVNAGDGTVTTVSVTSGNGVSAVVTNPSTTPAMAFTLGAITPTTVNSVTLSGSGTPTLAVTGTTTVSGVNTGDQTIAGTGAGSTLVKTGSGSALALKDLVEGSNITLTPAADGITITARAGGTAWNNVTGTTQTMAVNNGYIANNASLVTFTLPPTAAVGSVVGAAGAGAGGWKIAQNSGQSIHFGNATTTTGVGGYLASSNQWDSLWLICTTADTVFAVLGGPQGSPTVV